MLLFLANTTVIDRNSPHHLMVRDIIIRQNIIEAIAPAGTLTPPADAQYIAAENLHVSPGWVDMGVHLNDPGYEYKESLEALAEAAKRGGFTHVLCYPNTLPVADNAQTIRALYSRSQSFATKLLFSGAITQGTKGKDLAELYDMHTAGAVAFSDGTHALQRAGTLIRALQYTLPFQGKILTHPMDDSLADGGQMNEGIQATQLGVKGIPALAEVLAAHQLAEVYAYAQGTLAAMPVSVPQAAAILVQAQIPVGTTVAHLVFDDATLADFDVNYKLMPPLREAESMRQLRKMFADGDIRFLSSGHQPQSTEDKRVEFPQAEYGMLGLQTCFALANTHLVQTGEASIERLIAALAHAPREWLGLPAATLAEGAAASLTLFDPTASWQLSPADITSATKNTPLSGVALQGKVLGIV